MELYLGSLIHHLERGKAPEEQNAASAYGGARLLSNLLALLPGEEENTEVEQSILALQDSSGDLPVVLSQAYTLLEHLQTRGQELAVSARDEEEVMVFQEYLLDPDINKELFLVKQLGDRISVVCGSQHREPEEISREQVSLPPGVTLEVLGEKILKFTDAAGPFAEQSTGALSTWSDLLLNSKETRFHSHCFVIAHPFEANGEWHLNRYLERYPLMPEFDRRASHGSGISDSLQEFIDSDLRMMLEEKDFANTESTIHLAGGDLKVLGPNRFGEVLLVDTLPGMDEYSTEPLRMYYNLETDVLRAIDYFKREYTVVSGSLRSGEVVIEIPIQQGEEQQLLRHSVRPRIGNRFPLQSVSVEILHE